MRHLPFKPDEEREIATVSAFSREDFADDTNDWITFLVTHGAGGDVESFRRQRDELWESSRGKGLGFVEISDVLPMVSVGGRQAIGKHLDRVIADAEDIGVDIPLLAQVREVRTLVGASLDMTKGATR